MKHGHNACTIAACGLSSGPGATEIRSHDNSDYDFIFPNLKSFREKVPDSDEAVKELAQLMRDVGVNEALNNSKIPAGYTYLGQLVVHDMTQFRSNAHGVSGKSKGQNMRTPTLELDCIYGGGPETSAALYEPEVNSPDRFRCFFRLGALRVGRPGCFSAKQEGDPEDLPRIQEDSDGLYKGRKSYEARKGRTADPIIADPRNDDHLIIAQLQIFFMKLHNAVADILIRNNNIENREVFSWTHNFVTQCYRDVVLHDYLKKLLPTEIYDDLCSDEPALLQLPKNSPLARNADCLPIEFVMAGARIGHSMVRNHYAVNQCRVREKLKTLFKQSGSEMKKPLASDWVVEWDHFFGDEAQPSRKIAPYVAVLFLDRVFPSDLGEDLSLNALDLLRSSELPSGQSIAKKLRKHLPSSMKVPILKGDKILPVAHDDTNEDARAEIAKFLNKNPEIKRNTPLFYYILQEADSEMNGACLGPVGAYIVAVTFRRLLPGNGRAAPIIVSSMLELMGLIESVDVLERKVKSFIEQH